MEELKDRYEIIEETASDAIVTIDQDDKILSISRAAERIFGYSVRDIVGQPLDRIIPDYKRHVDEARRKSKSAPVVEVLGVHKSGRQEQLELSLGEYKKDNKHIYTAIIRDIATRKGTDRRLAAQFAVTRALAESSSLSVATPKLLQYVCEAVGWELGELWWVNSESNTLHIEGSWHCHTYEAEARKSVV